MSLVATARCADCYNVMYTDEMNPCGRGHWTCPGCLCDCCATYTHRELIPAWLRPQGDPLQELP